MPSYVVVWLLFVLAWTANFVIRIGFSALLPPIIQEMRLTYAQAGTLAAAFFWAYAATQIPAGILGDRFGRRRVLLLGLLGVVVATALTGLAGSFAALAVGRVATGAFQGALFSNDRPIITAVTPRERIALGQGVSFSGPGLGITVGLLLGGFLADRLPWRHVVLLFAMGPLLAALAIARWVPPMPPAATVEPLWPRFRSVLATRGVWVIGAAGACGIYVQFVLATWAPMLLLEAGVEGLAGAGTLSSLQGLAALAGPISGGWIDDRLRARGVRPTRMVTASLVLVAACTALVALALSRRSPLGLTVTLFAAAFFVWGIWGAVHALLGGLVPQADLGAAFGLFNALCFVGAIVGPTVTGWARDLTGTFVTGCVLGVLVALAGALIAAATPVPPDHAPRPRAEPARV